MFSKETLERKANGRSKVLRPMWLFALALVYNIIHSIALFYQVITLNVAVNSYSNALLTLLMSNQFVEIKGTVFKKFEKESLFQMTCADVVERFQLWLMLVIMGPFFFVLGTETLVDWVKHAYITKFNNVKPNIYGRFLDVMAKDFYSNVRLPMS